MPIRENIPTSRLFVLAVLLGCAAGCASKPAPEEGATTEGGARTISIADAATREPLASAARELLGARMRRHGPDMTQLLSAVVVLDWPSVQRTSELMIEEPVMARPLPGDGESFNAQLPEAFFVRQRALLGALRELQAAARHQSDHELKLAFNGVAGACMDCHAAYLVQSAQPDILHEP